MPKYRTQSRPSDAGKLDFIEEWLSKNDFGVKVTERNKIIWDLKFQSKNHQRDTDLLLNGECHLQHDTVKSHGELGFPNPQTEKRDIDYALGNYRQIIINQDLARMLGLHEGALSVYLFFHDKQLEFARQKARELVQY